MTHNKYINTRNRHFLKKIRLSFYCFTAVLRLFSGYDVTDVIGIVCRFIFYHLPKYVKIVKSIIT